MHVEHPFFYFRGLTMHRNILIRLLEDYYPIALEEQLFKQQMLEFILQHEDCFERFLEKGHITASALLLNKNHTHALLMHHAKLDKWFQLGGHCDGNSNVFNVAIKEAQEESGIMKIEPVTKSIFDIDIHLIPANKKEKEHYHYDVRFLLHITSDEEIVQNNESKELRWISKNHNELPTNEQSVVRMFNKWIALE
jgi:8-oxo-dGTP pyrophosphatase MutT (NUDIX family)